MEAGGMTSKRRQPVLGRIRHIHMVGIGGIGMSSIAAVLLDRGYRVTGSDLNPNDITRNLENQGATIYEGHKSRHVAGADVVVYSSAVSVPDNEETVEAAAHRIPLIPRSEMLGELMRMKFGVGIAGTHGKTTTTTMVGLVVAEGGFDPTIIVGGKVAGVNSNAVSGEGDIIVIEADEYDRAFLRLTPALSVITTLEAEHMDIYRDMDDLRAAFEEFANAVPFFGAAIVCLDDPGVQGIVDRIERRLITYGLARQAMVRADHVRQEGTRMHFDVMQDHDLLGSVVLSALGLHNVRNALAAIAVGLELCMDFADIKAGLERFAGVQRRFQRIGESDGILIVDDYAHHPTEVIATLAAACEGYPDRRIVAVFQPHLYSRTLDFKDGFAHAFFNADVLVVMDVYPAREQPLDGVSGEMIATLASQRGHRNAHFAPGPEDVLRTLDAACRRGDLVVFMGAGDIWRVARRFAERLAA